MQALFALTLANIRSYVRDRAALFWTLAFPLVFIVMFGLIFQGGGGPTLTLGLGRRGRRRRRRPQLHELRSRARTASSLVDTTQADAIDQMKLGKVDAVIVVPKGYGAGRRRERGGHRRRPRQVTVYTDPSRQQLARLGLPGGRRRARRRQPRRPAAARRPDSRRRSRPRTSTSSATSCRACSGCRSCRSGSSPPSRWSPIARSCILKRLAATPLRRWQLVGSNVLMRLLIALAQAIIIVGVGTLAFGVEIVGSHARHVRVRRPGRGGVPRARLRDRVVRHDRGLGQRDDQHRSSSR